jgi:hypothetical protein
LPRTPGHAVFPNSAPLSFTPKYSNLVLVPVQDAPDVGAEPLEVLVGGVEAGAEPVVDEPGKHWLKSVGSR